MVQSSAAHAKTFLTRPWPWLTAAAILLVLATSGCASSDSTDGAATAKPTTQATEISQPSEVRQAIAEGAQIIDVRTPEEFAGGALRDATNIDVSAPGFEERISDLDRTTTYVVYCASGNRAGTAIEQMREQGFESLINGGGYEDVAAAGLPTT